jgi:hypothetical protein
MWSAVRETTELREHSMPSPLLDGIRSRIEAQLAAGTEVLLDEGLTGVANVANLLSGAIGVGSLALQNASLVVQADSLTVRGLAPLLEPTSIPVEVQFRDQGGLVLTIEGRVPAVTPLASAVQARFLRARFPVPSGLQGLRVKTATVTVNANARTALVVLADSGDFEVADLLTIRQPKLTLAGTDVDQAAPAVSAQFEGLLLIANVPFRMKGQVGGESAFSVTPASADLLVTSEQLLQQFLGSSVARIPSLPLTDLGLNANFDTDTYALTATLSGTWRVPLGISPPELSGLSLTISKTPAELTGRLQGRATVAGQVVDIRASLPGELVLAGELAPLDLSELVQAVAGGVLTLPAGTPGLRLDASRFFVRFEGPNPSLAVQTKVNLFGPVLLLVVRIGDEWQAVVAFVPPSDWSFSRLSAALSPLDALKIRDPRLILASFKEENFAIPDVEGNTFGRRISKGIQLDAALALQGAGLDFVAALLGTTELPLRLAVEGDFGQAEVGAVLGSSLELVPAVLVLENFELAIKPTPFAITLRSEARVIIQGDALPRFRVGAVIGAGTQRIVLETAEPWVKPFGISGLTVQQVVLDIQTAPAPLYGILGDVAVAGRTLRIACQFAGSAPSALVGELTGKLSLGEVVRDLVGIGLPPVLDMSIEDFSLQVVSNPLGVTIGSVHFEPGLTLRGTLGMLGLELLANVRIRPDQGVFAQGSLKKRVEFGNVLVISDAAGSGPPSMTLDTSGSPLLRLTGQIVLLGLSESIDATVERSGFTVALDRNLGIGRYTLDVRYESISSFRANGSFAFGLKASIDTDIGKIVLDTGCSGRLAVSMVDGQFELVAEGSFTFVGNSFNTPTLRITAAIDSLEQLPDRIRGLVAEKAEDIFRSVLEDPAKWVQAIAAGAIREVENVAKILKERFGESAEVIGRQLKTVLNQSSVEVAQALKGIGETPEKIAGVLRDLGDEAANVRNALERIGVPAAEISNILSNVFHIPHLDEALHTDVHTDSPFVPAMQIHTDSPFVPAVRAHLDSPFVPAVRAHTDSPFVPAVRAHTDSPFVPGVRFHSDEAGPHVDFHGDAFGGGPHGDSRGPHVDIHTDTPDQGHIDIHTDTPEQGHVDIHTDTPEQGHVDAHTDTPEQGHVDIHTDTPEQGHVDIHVDTAIHGDAP